MSLTRILLDDVQTLTKLYVERVKDNPDFKQWFGDSKVTDKNGDPKIVFHATDKDFSSFERGDVGYHFGSSQSAKERILRPRGGREVEKIKSMGSFPYQKLKNLENIETYKNKVKKFDIDNNIKQMIGRFLDAGIEVMNTWSEMDNELVWKNAIVKHMPIQLKEFYDIEEKGEGERTGAFFLSIENPFVCSDITFWDEYDPEWLLQYIESNDHELTEELVNTVLEHKANSENLRKILKMLDHDGIRYLNEHEDKGSISWIAFEPTQIKSIWNDGSFDPNDKNFMS